MKVIFDGIDWRMQDVPGNSRIEYVANGIELMRRIYCVQMIGRLNLWWDWYFDNSANKLTIHETEIHYCDKIGTCKGDTVFWDIELELFNLRILSVVWFVWEDNAKWVKF
jgi:hypothetical protein